MIGEAIPATEQRVCQWGRGVRTAEDPHVCLSLAVRRFVVQRRSDGKSREFEMCDPHLRVVLAQADAGQLGDVR